MTAAPDSLGTSLHLSNVTDPFVAVQVTPNKHIIGAFGLVAITSAIAEMQVRALRH
jgi:hypothetical protein